MQGFLTPLEWCLLEGHIKGLIVVLGRLGSLCTLAVGFLGFRLKHLLRVAVALRECRSVRPILSVIGRTSRNTPPLIG